MESGKLFGISAVFFGIISVLLSMVFFISFPAAILAMTFGIFAVRRFYRKSGTTGIVLGIIGIIITIVVFVNIVQALDVGSLIEGKWYTEDGEYVNFTDRGAYVWYQDKENKDNYSSGYYTLSSGVYKNGRRYTMGYTVTLKQLKDVNNGNIDDEEYEAKWLIYTPGEDVVDDRSNNYEMINLKTCQVVKLQKEEKKLIGIF